MKKMAAVFAMGIVVGSAGFAVAGPDPVARKQLADLRAQNAAATQVLNRIDVRLYWSCKLAITNPGYTGPACGTPP